MNGLTFPSDGIEAYIVIKNAHGDDFLLKSLEKNSALTNIRNINESYGSPAIVSAPGVIYFSFDNDGGMPLYHSRTYYVSLHI